MRISGKTGSVGGSQGLSSSKTPSAPAITPSNTATVSDALQVSSSARLIAVAHEVLAVTPDIRSEKVEAIKTQLDADRYQPDGEAVAEGLIREHLAKGSDSQP